MLYRDIKDDAKIVFGNCDGPELRRRVTEAVNILANSADGNWDGMIGEMTICVDQVSGTVTLPRDVLKPISINVDGCPTFPRDRWFLYHLNGPGGRGNDIKAAWDDRGSFPVFREPSEPTKLSFAISDGADNGKSVRVRALNEDDVEITIEVVLSDSAPQESTETIKRVLGVNKDAMEGLLTMSYVDPTAVVAGIYQGDEINPSYRRIRVRAANNIQMIYRRTTRAIVNDDSYIPLDSQMAVLQALWSIKHRFNGNIAEAQAHQMDAIQLLQSDQYARMVSNAPAGPQVLDYSTNNSERLRWDGADYRGFH